MTNKAEEGQFKAFLRAGKWQEEKKFSNLLSVPA
jgi:hypothetical protein